jgi:3',5'-cyclic AMP phosphodiesterase CpdA
MAWISDPHLNFAPDEAIDNLYREARGRGAGAVLISGDLAEAHVLEDYLTRLAKAELPTYFVLGNHDYYRGDVVGVRRHVRALCASHPGLHWLNAAGPVSLSRGTVLVGVDGWADARLGDYEGSEVLLNDALLIRDLAWLEKSPRREMMQALADADASVLRDQLARALASPARQVVVLTHIPPFAEAAWHEGRTSTSDWLPHMTCKAVGEVVREAAASHPDRRFLVLCGHTHGAGECEILPNLRVLTAGAAYCQPRIHGIIDLP